MNTLPVELRLKIFEGLYQNPESFIALGHMNHAFHALYASEGKSFLTTYLNTVLRDPPGTYHYPKYPHFRRFFCRIICLLEAVESSKVALKDLTQSPNNKWVAVYNDIRRTSIYSTPPTLSLEEMRRMLRKHLRIRHLAPILSKVKPPPSLWCAQVCKDCSSESVTCACRIEYYIQGLYAHFFERAQKRILQLCGERPLDGYYRDSAKFADPNGGAKSVLDYHIVMKFLDRRQKMLDRISAARGIGFEEAVELFYSGKAEGLVPATDEEFEEIGIGRNPDLMSRMPLIRAARELADRDFGFLYRFLTVGYRERMRIVRDVIKEDEGFAKNMVPETVVRVTRPWNLLCFDIEQRRHPLFEKL